MTRSPLLVVFYLKGGRLEAVGEDLKLAIRELVQDFGDDSSGHIVVRQRESDAMVDEIVASGNPRSTKRDRRQRIELRDQLHRLTRQESRGAEGVRLMLTDPQMTSWLM